MSEEVKQEIFEYELVVDKTPFVVGDKKFEPKAELHNGVLLYTAVEKCSTCGKEIALCFCFSEAEGGHVSYKFQYKVSPKNPILFMKHIKAGPENSH
jgi:hypothetical protein